MFAPQTDYELYGLYCWNDSVSQCLQSLLSIVEITLRNSLSREFARAHIIQQQPQNLHWYECIVIHPKSKEKIENVTHMRRGRRKIPKFPAPTHNDVVAGLSFGFWKHLLDVRNYLNGSAVPIGDILTQSFPNHPQSIPTFWARQRNQDPLFSRLDLLSDIRNRIAHLEPVWKFGVLHHETRMRPNTQLIIAQPQPQTSTDCLSRLTLILNRAIELLHWLSPHRANDFRASVTHKKLRHLLTQQAISDFKMCYGNKTVNLSALYRMYKRNLQVDGILHLDDARMQRLVIMPWI